MLETPRAVSSGDGVRDVVSECLSHLVESMFRILYTSVGFVL